MIRIFWFLFSHSLVNRMRRRLARLREPRYVLPFLLGIGWIFYWGSRAFSHGGVVRVMSPGGGAFGDDARAAIVLAGSLFLFAWTALLWLIPTKRAALEFTPAEIHFLFTAPITRRQIVHYKLVKAQIGILFGAFVTAFLWGRMWSAGGWQRLAGFWLLYALLHLHALGAGFVRTGLIEQGVSGLRRRVIPIVVLLAFVGFAWVGLREAWPALSAAWQGMWTGPPGDPDLSTSGAKEFLRIVVGLGTSGVLGALLWPFSIMPHAVFATDFASFAFWFGAGVLVLVLHYFWVVSAETAFEEASVEAAAKRAAKVAWAREVRRRGGAVVKKASPFFWKLGPRGRPEVAIVWKNLVGMTRVVPVRAMIALVSIVFAMIAWTVGLSEQRATLGVVIGLLLPQLALFFAVLGPLFVRNDLREDVFRLDALKTIPVAGHAIVWGEILAPTLVLATLEVTALVAGMIVLAASGTSAIGPLGRDWWIAIGVSAALVLPALSLASVALQNALVLLFPAWVSVGNSRARGFEASGQRLLTLFGTVVFLAVIGLPAALAGGVLSWVLAAPLGALCLLPGALVAAGWIVIEIAIACRALGKMFDKLDPSSAGIEPREAS